MFVVSTESVSEVVASIFWILDVPSSLVTIVERTIERESRLFPIESCNRKARGKESQLLMRVKERMKAYLDPSSRKYYLLLLLKR